MSKTFGIALLILMSGATCFGQSSYKGLTPGKSTRADVERVLGRPLKELSKSFAEYQGTPNIKRIYVQYDSEGPSATVIRIELVCEGTPGNGCGDFTRSIKVPGREYDYDAIVLLKPDSQFKHKIAYYLGPPVYGIITNLYPDVSANDLLEMRSAIYSKELYEVTLPKSCNGTIFGVWNTNRGRLAINRPSAFPESGEFDIKGDYSPGGGTISGTGRKYHLNGRWTDSTGGGTMSLKLKSVSQREATRTFSPFITGTWERTSGKGPKNGAWEGRCVETN